MQRFLTSLVLILALGLGTDAATALGLGKATPTALLGQPLSFTIGLRLDSNENLEAKCVKAEVNFGDRVLPETMVLIRLETAAATGERRLRVSTTLPVDEPVVGIHLRFGCPFSLSRSFTLLADPPGVAASSTARDGFEPDRVHSAVSQVLSAVPAGAQASVPAFAAPRARERRSPPSTARSGATSGPTSAAAGTRSGEPRARRRAEAPVKPRGPVLRLDPVEADALILPSLQMDTRLSPMPEQGASGVPTRYLDPETAQRLQERERLQAMETALLKLRADSQATQKSLDDMQLRVRAAEAGRYANPLVYLLIVLCLLLSAAVAAMWWLRRRDRAAAAWWAEQPGASPAAEPSAEVVSEAGVTSTGFSSAPQPLSVAPVAEPPMPPLPPAAPPRASEPDAVVEPRRPMSAEELIDLEQQAEFFVVLGQDDAAIDLLMGHVRSTGGVSPLPYLKLLEIYRRRGEREPYDRIRERFNRRFNAYAPEWGVDPEEGLSLEGYPEVMHRLQDAWRSPSQSMELLDGALFRRDAGPTFDVPAYRELLFLYSTARDLAERHTDPEGVDLLLPMGDEGASTMTSVPASPEVQPRPAALEPFSLDLDVSTDQPSRLSLEDPDFKRSDR
jgi:pilus assembly protein FimV